MASMRDIKRRKSSIQSTQQITKAMKLVSTVKLQRAKQRAENSKAYFDCMYQTVSSMLAKAGGINHPYVTGNDSKKKAVVLITGNRGLAGGYNSNIIKLITKGDFVKEDLDIYAIGSKGRDMLARNGYQIKALYKDLAEEPAYADAMGISRDLLKAYNAGEVGEIYLAYTHFKNTVSHIPKIIRLLPADTNGIEVQEDVLMNFEPKDEEALELIIPKYVTSLIYGGLVESVASENGARMQAMDSATSNAEEMIDSLSLLYNRARQGAITQELTEIIAGAEAIS
jgi:F-type H+-transporting ATPase subunit gamma